MANGAPVQWRAENGGNGHWYEVNIHAEGPISWPQADAQANAAGGHLATIGSEAENLFVSNLVAAEPYKPNDLGPWLGGYQPDGSPEPAGGWSWVTGEPWDYTHWGDGEPNNYWNPSTDEEEAYLELFIANTGSVVGYYWNDSWGQSQSPVNWYVVEYEPVPEPATMLLIGTGSLGVFGWIRRKRSK